MQIIILSPFEPVRSVLRRMIESIDPEITVKESSNQTGITAVIKTCCPALLFMSLPTPADGGIQWAERIKTKFPDVTVVVMTSYDYPEYTKMSTTSVIDRIIAEESMGRQGIEGIIQEARTGCRITGAPP